MKRSRFIDFLSATSWMMMAACAVTLVFLALTIPSVISKVSKAERDKSVEEIRSSTDLHEVQQIAAWRTQEAAYVKEATRILLILSVTALLVCLLGAGMNLSLIRRLRKELNIAGGQAG